MQMLPMLKWTSVAWAGGGRGRSETGVTEARLVAFTTFNFHNDYDMQYMAAHVRVCVGVTVCVCACKCVCL